MKNIFLAIATISILFSACNKESFTADELLILEIAESTEKISIENTDIPTNIKEDCNYKYFETFIRKSSKVESKGYELGMDSDAMAYYTLEGRKLEWSEKKGKKKWGKGKKDKDEYCKSKFVETAYLPAAITNYMTANHPSLIVKGGKYFYKGFYLLATDTKDIIVFDDKGAYQKTIDFFSCNDKDTNWGTEVSAQDLPITAQSYLSTNYANHTIEKAFQKNGEFFVYIYDGTTKLLVGFDDTGNFMFVK